MTETGPDLAHGPRLAQRAIVALSAPIVWNTGELTVGATIGMAVCPVHGLEAEALLRAADLAMYRAKRDGRGRFCLFEQSMDHELQDRAALESDLRTGLMEGLISPHYQPLVSPPDQTIYGFEILARWHHPEKGSVAPSVFIPIAEDVGLIADLTYELLRQACVDAKAWPSHLSLSLNISPVQLKDRWLPERLLRILTETGFSPRRLEVEVTEDALIDDLETAKLVLSSLRKLPHSAR